jgi:hypothetical protein
MTALKKTNLTYGVEMEFVFTFHESELEPIFGTTNGVQAQIKKHISFIERETKLTRTNSCHLPGQYYNSLGLMKQEQARNTYGYNLASLQIVNTNLTEIFPELASSE